MTQSSFRQYIIDAIASVIPPKGGAYVAGPLATGRDHYELLAAEQKTAGEKIRPKNEQLMHYFIHNLRGKLSYPVIDPTLLKIPEWSAQEIGDFYIQLIELFAKEVWFMDGWEFSRGATKEFQFCIAKGIRCLNSSGAILSSVDGITKIMEAADYLHGLGLDSSRFIDRANAIRSGTFP